MLLASDLAISREHLSNCLNLVRCGVWIARTGWLEVDGLNCLDACLGRLDASNGFLEGCLGGMVWSDALNGFLDWKMLGTIRLERCLRYLDALDDVNREMSRNDFECLRSSSQFQVC